MASAYSAPIDPAKFVPLANKVSIPLKDHIPEEIVLPKSGLKVIFDEYNHQTDESGLYSIFDYVVNVEGNSYPQETTDLNQFRAYFLSHNAFVFRTTEPTNGYPAGQVIGGFYVKPNFPGRSSHISNGGVIIHQDFRRHGLGRVAFSRMIQMAKVLGYHAFYTNLVYASNTGSATICRSLGMTLAGTLPKAGRLKGQKDLVDAYQFYMPLQE